MARADSSPDSFPDSFSGAFAPLLGTWQGLERLQGWAFAGDGDARAILTWKFDIGSTIVVQDYRQVRADGSEFIGHGVFHAEGDLVRWWFFDSAGYPPVPAEGGFDAGGELVLTKITERGTAVHRWRLDGAELEYRIAYGPPGREPAPFLGGRYRRLDTH